MLSGYRVGHSKRKPHAPLTSLVRPFVAFRLLDTQIGLTFSAEIYHGTRYKCE